jgi:threonine/homoserine/homoserine lactone efflux protein
LIPVETLLAFFAISMTLALAPRPDNIFVLTQSAQHGRSAGLLVTLGRLALYRCGTFMNITNPKVSIFFLAILPQFADPTRGALVLQLVLLGGIFIVATVLVFGAVALLAGELGQCLQRSAGTQRAINKVAAVVFVALAFRLLFARP